MTSKVAWEWKPWPAECLAGNHKPNGNWQPWGGLEDEHGNTIETCECTECGTSVGRSAPAKKESVG